MLRAWIELRRERPWGEVLLQPAPHRRDLPNVNEVHGGSSSPCTSKNRSRGMPFTIPYTWGSPS
jgi:hypothetical protein